MNAKPDAGSRASVEDAFPQVATDIALTGSREDQKRGEDRMNDTDLNNLRDAYNIASEAADRFRDVLCEVLGCQEWNPGDDALIARLREHFGKTGPEPAEWRRRMGYCTILLEP